jgi:glycine/D-amino acid oxidase-like deaminating enzyme
MAPVVADPSERTQGVAVISRPPIEESCYWLARAPRGMDSPLEGTQNADVAIVGAGFTGLWAAHHLKNLDPNLDVVVIDQGRAAYGASGRNAGMLGEAIDHTHGLAVAHFGVREAERLARLGKQNVAELRGFLEDRGIDCDLEQTGMLHVALKESQVEQLVADLHAARALGVSGQVVLNREEIRAEIHSERYMGALFNPSGILVDPVKLVEGLRREALARGVRIHEGTKVTALERDGAAARVVATGEVRARKVLLAMSAYTHHLLPEVLFRFMPLYDYIITSNPLTNEEREIIGWRNRQGVADTRNFFKYYRLTKDDRVLWGTSEAQYYRGNRVDESCDHSERLYEHLRQSFGRHFPELANLAFPYAWGGPICATTRFTPFFGSALGGRVLYALGFTGHGLGTTHLAGKILAHMALAKPTELLELKLVTEKPFPYPPEPLRGWAVSAVSHALRRVDAGGRPNTLLRILDLFGVGLSS